MLSRREFLGRAAAAAAGGLALTTGLSACIDTVDPSEARIDLSSEEFLKAKQSGAAFPYRPATTLLPGFFVVPYTVTTAGGRRYVDDGVVDAGFMVVVDRCTYDRCRVNYCEQSRWFECPCHGCKFNLAGEYKLGPAPRGLDRFKMQVSGDTLIVFPKRLVKGPRRGINTTGQEKEGPFCH